MGKGASYVSSKKAKNQPPSLDALTHMAFQLEQQIQDFEDDVRSGDASIDDWSSASVLWELQNQLFEEIREIVLGRDNLSPADAGSEKL